LGIIPKPPDNHKCEKQHKSEEKHEHQPEQIAELVPFTNSGTTLFVGPAVTTTIKVPIVTAEPTLQIVVETDIKLHPAATEIKRVKKNVFLEQVKLVPVALTRIDNTDYFNVTRGKLFVAGHIRKNIEYASHECKGTLQDRIVDVPFSGFTDIAAFTNPPIIGIAETAEANFLNEKTNLDARLDKYFFNNLIKYNEQPFGELVAANFFELDFSPTMTTPEGSFSTLREKIVLELTLKVLQVQQIQFTASPVVPVFTPPPTA
jgi:hypothetical protein